MRSGGGDRRALAQIITRMESTRHEQSDLGQAVLEALVPYTGGSVRLGITGRRVSARAPSSKCWASTCSTRDCASRCSRSIRAAPVSGGSILGDKTRMEQLAREERAFIRPSPSGGSLGGVAHRTRESMLLCEAAGYDVVLVETVGIGQSEVTVASMVDFFLVLLLPTGGDELQGIKRGVMELADAIVVNKADGEMAAAAERTRAEYAGALELIRPASTAWKPVALKRARRAARGSPRPGDTVLSHRARLEGSGELARHRREQARAWMWNLVEAAVKEAFRKDPGVAAVASGLERDVEALKTTPAAAARELLAAFRSR